LITHKSFPKPDTASGVPGFSYFREHMLRPTEIIAGDTYTWTSSSSDYPASDGWTLKVTINNATIRVQESATTNANGKDYDVTLASTNTDDFTTVGVCAITEAVEKGTGPTLERHTIFQGSVNMVKSIAAASAAIDVRTTARKMLDAIDATILTSLGKGHESMSIAARAIGYRSWDEMLRVQQRLEMKVKAEENAAAIAQGLEPNKPLRTRFAGIV
jgi:hypothetical protein